MPYAPIIQPSTQLDAVNACLAAGGEAPVQDLVGQRPDVAAAQGFVADAVREILAEGWSFNTEVGYEVAPAGTVVWPDTSGASTTLNVFTPPNGLLSFEINKHRSQQGSRYVDTVVRPSRLYGGGNTLVFYDRARNRDGWLRSFLYIDPVWLFDFDKCPQEARTVFTHRAVGRFCRTILNDANLAGQYAMDERVALRSLKRNFGKRDDYNVFNNIAVTGHLGGRMLRPSGVLDGRASSGLDE